MYMKIDKLRVSKLRLYAALPLLVLMISFLGVTLSPAPALAAPDNTPGIDDTSNDPNRWNITIRAQRWAHMTALQACIDEASSSLNNWNRDAFRKTMTEEDLKSNDWFGGLSYMYKSASYLTDLKPSEDPTFGLPGKVHCNDIVKETVNLYGFKNGLELYCSFKGAVRKDGSGCLSGKSTDRINLLEDGAVSPKIWGGKQLPSGVDKASYYKLRIAALTHPNGCSFSDPGDDTKNIYTIKNWVNKDGTISEKKFTGKEKDREIYIYTSNTGRKQQSRTCKSLADEVNNNREEATAYANWLKSHKDDPNLDTNSTLNETPDAAETSSCDIDGIGWMICPVMTFMGKVTDAAYGVVDNFLRFDARIIDDDSLRAAWSTFRNIANVLFVLAFLVLIYSQMTGLGLNNYGVKKMMPKLIVAAILVNVSLWLCAIAVDISNILGVSLKSLFDNLPVSTGGGGATTIEKVGQGLTWGVIMLGILTAGALLLMSVALPVILAALLAIAMILLILMLRQALIILLIVVSPIAFVAYLLPNTEQWFKKWMKLFGSLLMLYPIVAVVFGASAFAANLVANVGSGDITSGGLVDGNEFLQITALGIATVPLFVVPGLLKGALNATGSIGAKLGNLSGKAAGMTGRLGKSELKRRATNIEGAMAERGGVIGAAGNYRTRRSFRRKSADARALRQQNEALSQHVLANPHKYEDEVVDQMFDEEVKRSATAQRNWSMKDVARAAASGIHPDGRQLSDTERSAAIQRTMESGGFGQRREVIENLGGASREVQQRAIRGIYSKGDQNIYGTDIGDQILDGLVNNASTLQQQAVNNAANGNVTAEHLADSPSGSAWLIETALVNQPNSTARTNLGTAAGEAVSNEATRRKLTTDHTRAFGAL